MASIQPRRARRYDPDRRARIADAAIRVVGRDGVDNVSVRAIAQEADVPVGSVNYHFRGKDDLIESAVALASERNAAALRGILARFAPETDLAAALAGLVEELTLRDRDQLVHDYELFMAARRRPPLVPASRRWVEESNGLLVDFVDGVPAAVLGQVLQGLLLEAVVLGKPFTAPEVEPMFRYVLDRE